jgi:hypothetical protein
LQQEFEALEYHGNADQQLLELKKKMGLLAPGEEAEQRQLTSGENEEIAEAEVVEETPEEDASEEAAGRES